MLAQINDEAWQHNRTCAIGFYCELQTPRFAYRQS